MLRENKLLAGMVCQKLDDLLFGSGCETEARFVFLQANRSCLEGLDRCNL
jgi:hypothetical protein